MYTAADVGEGTDASADEAATTVVRTAAKTAVERAKCWGWNDLPQIFISTRS